MKIPVTIVLLFFPAMASHANGQEKELSSIMARDSITGMQVVYQKGAVTREFDLGVKCKRPWEAVQANTIFQAASLSKTVVAYAALRMYDKGQLNLDTPLYVYSRNPKMDRDTLTRSITARMVLTHTSGLPNWSFNPFSPVWDTVQYALQFKPGTAWSYSGEGFVCLQRAMEAITGKGLQEIAAEEVFIPLRMTRSSFIWEPSLDTFLANGHADRGKEKPRSRNTKALAAATLLTTASEFNLFLRALVTGKGLKPDTWKMMLRKAVTPDRFGEPHDSATARLGWGLGLGLENNDKGEAIWHWGDNGDFKCFFMAYPGTRESIIFMTNDENGLRHIEDILSVFLGRRMYWSARWLAY
jgi:CubicO group peptidase (beta-lactamase class C family)